MVRARKGWETEGKREGKAMPGNTISRSKEGERGFLHSQLSPRLIILIKPTKWETTNQKLSLLLPCWSLPKETVPKDI